MAQPTDKPRTPHVLQLSCREKGELTGVEKVLAASETALRLRTSCGILVVVGEKLHIVRYDEQSGTLETEGVVSSLKYEGAKVPLFKRIFR